MSPRGPYPTRSVPAARIEKIGVEIAGTVHTAAAGGSVEVTGARVTPGNWANIECDVLTIRFGHRAGDMLDKLVEGADQEKVQIASLLLASVCGHPRGDQPGEPLEFVWSDHVALANGTSLQVAFEISDVMTPQRQWLKSLEGKVRVIDL